MRPLHLFLPLVGLALGLPRSALALDEAQVYGIANFGSAGECTGGKTHLRHTVTAANFLEPFQDMTVLGQWDETSTMDNLDARGSYFTDSTKATSCACTADDQSLDTGVDEADVIFVHTHGGHTASGNVYYSNLAMGNASYDCSVRTDNNMKFGVDGGDLEIAVVKACQSGDYDVWANQGYRQQLTESGSTMSMWNAFHGNSSCTSATEAEVSAYAWSSLSDGAGDNWLDLFYDDDAGVDSDDCPTSIVMGSSSSLRSTMYTYGGFMDRIDTGSKTGSTIHYIGGCDPANGIVLPN
jgi:hypothetical protein